jgi:hypothetical protein
MLVDPVRDAGASLTDPDSAGFRPLPVDVRQEDVRIRL